MRLPTSGAPLALTRSALLALSIIGWGLFVRMLIINVEAAFTLAGSPVPGMAVDTYAYWLAGSHVAAGEPVYRAVTVAEFGAYLYPPPFALAWTPISALPPIIADWGWRVLGVLCIRYMAGSWQVSGLWMLFPGTIVELTAGNVTLQVAALTVAGIRGHAEGVFPAALVKLSSVLVVPFLWFCRPWTRRGLLIGAAIVAGAVTVSLLVSPSLWREFLDTLPTQSGSTFEGTSIVHLLPTPGADYLLRLAIAAVVVVASVGFGSSHLAYLAAFLATPTLWVQRFSVLMALPTLEGGSWLHPYLWRTWRSAS